MPVLDSVTAVSADVLKVEHRNSEPFDAPLNPATIETIEFTPGLVAAVDANGYVVPATAANLESGSEKKLGLFMLPRNPSDVRKNDYVAASGNASIFTNGIVTLDVQISDATVAVKAPLYATDTGLITTSAPTTPGNAYIGWAMEARSAAGDPIRVKLEL